MPGCMYCDLQNRAPRVELLPDGRYRVTRAYDILNSTAKTRAELEAQVFIARGSADTVFTDCYLITQTVTGENENPFDDPNKAPPQLIRVYEQLAANGAETRVGNSDVTLNQDDFKTVVDTFYQLSTGTRTPQTPGTTTAATPNTDCVLKEEKCEDKGTLRIITRTYINKGLISEVIEPHDDGTREVTWLSVGTRLAPVGVVVFDEFSDHGHGILMGAKTFTVKSRQTKTGGADLTVISETRDLYVPFSYPGRAKPYDHAVGNIHFIDVFKSPPAEVVVPGRVKITYQTSNALGALDNPIYNAGAVWATLAAYWIGMGQNERFENVSLRGFRAVTYMGSPIVIDHTFGSIRGVNIGTCLGEAAWGGSSCSLTVTGGPGAPDGNTYTVGEPKLEVAFTSTDGVIWYRKVVLEAAAVPAQTALPV